MQSAIASVSDHHGTQSVPAMTDIEKNQLLAWNNTKTNYPKHQTIIDLFEQQVEKTPDNIAIIFQEQKITYQQLNAKANQVAHYLHRNRSIQTNMLIGICVERSVEMVIGLLAILKVGGAYVPIDPSYPATRIEYMLTDSAISIVLTQTKFQTLFTNTVICLDNHQTLENQAITNLTGHIDSQALAYVGYTSGSTGQPKGVCIPHRAVVRLVKNTNYIEFTENQVFLQLAPLSFDASTFEIWGSLLNGGKLVLMPPQYYSLSHLANALQTHQITTLWLTSGLFHFMVDEYLEALSSVKQLLAGGDVLSVERIKKVRQRFPDCQLINGYGPTENTTFTSCCALSNFELHDTAPIGKPIANTRIHILDEQYQPVPIGVAGELCAAGDGLARGYLNRPDLTAEKFIEIDIFGKTERIYKTGDLARWLPDGNIEFLGRVDNQVKIRGFRIELGEIEAVLTQHDAVKDAVVIVQQSKNSKSLIACLSLQQPLETEVLHDWLKARLPDYMLPTRFKLFDQLPLNANGKIDRKMLERDITKQ